MIEPMAPRPFRIAPALSAADLEAVGLLFDAYAASLPIDLAYQGFEAERASLPGRYGPPGGALFLARDLGDEALGCVALRPIAPPGCCEMKRLYVTPAGRGLGLGRALADAIVAEATRIGHREMRLDTLPTMSEAIALYRVIGFAPIPPYYDTPVAGTIFLARPLDPAL